MKHWLIQDIEGRGYRLIAENNLAVSVWAHSLPDLFSTPFPPLDPNKPTNIWDIRYSTLNSGTVISPSPGETNHRFSIIATFNTKPTFELIQDQYPELLL